MMKLPDSMTGDFFIYLTSDKEDLDMTIGLRNLTSVPEFQEPDIQKLVADNGLKTFADDWRLMTKDEVQDYLKRQREEQAAQECEDL